MSVDGFNKRYKRIRNPSDTIIVNYDPTKITIDEVVRVVESISNVPERHKGTIFRITPEGMWFQNKRR